MNLVSVEMIAIAVMFVNVTMNIVVVMDATMNKIQKKMA